ncbi:uncharacterized protein [Asterias amurensis]|uniref:uncharacterized protein n=1 Tax=Asterias amurensis TaxID=7602 RepID=UPI003AB6C44C
MTASLVLAFALAIVSGQSYAQEMCAVNQCSNGENCYNRPGSAEGFVCECNLPFRDNYNCAVGPDNQEIYTCYGSTCTSGTFVSKDYPNNYPNRYRALYLLYIPGASGITFTFNSPFGIETDKDELYIGKGLSVDFNLLQGTSTVGPDVRFFEGNVLPSDFTIDNTDVAWLYFITDKNIQFNGFSVQFRMVDQSPPVISNCPTGVTVTTATAQAQQAFWVAPTATDAETFTTVSSHVPGQTFSVGITPVTYTFTDLQGNQATCTFNVNVIQIDNQPPTITVPAEDVTITVPFGTPGTNVNWVEPQATDNSGSVFTSRTHVPGSFFNVGDTVVTYTFVDPLGNAVTAPFTVRVVELADTIDPVVLNFPEDVTVTVPFGTPSANVPWDTPVVTDNSGTVFPTTDRQPGSSFPPGTTPVTYTFTDPAGNSVTRTFNVNVIVLPDSTNPVVTSFPDDITVTVPFGTNSIPVSWDQPTATDNSGSVFPSSDRPTGSTFPIGTTPVTYTFTDPTGNRVTRTFNVNVVMLADTIDPVVLNFPEDVTVTVPFGTPSANVPWDTPVVTDNSGTVFPTTDRQPGSSFPPGTTPVTYTFTDPAGNSVTRTFNVNVIVLPDSTNPVVTSFPDDITVTVPFGTNSIPVSWDQPTATDNSGSVFPSSDRPSGSTFPIGTTPVTYTFTDPTGNRVTRTFNVNVVMLADSTDPFIVSFPDDITVSVPFGTPSTPVNWEEPTAFDNSGTVFPSKSAEPGSSFPTGQTTPVTYTFTDPTGNSVTRQFTVTVVELPDGTPPEVSDFPQDITRTVPFGTTSVTVTWVEPTVTDNSGTVTPSSDRPSGSSFLPGTTPVTYNFVDPTGNSVTRSFNVNVIVLPDSTDPFIVSFPDDITVSVPFGTPSTPVNWEEPTAFDNSGTVFPSKSAEPGSSFPTGQTTPVTYTFSDPTGNSVTRQFTVTVVELPDGTPPEVSDFPQDITRTVPFGTTSVTVTWVEPTVTDNSGTVTPSSDRPSGSSFLPGTTPVTYNFVDPTGNSVTRSFNVNVIVLPDSTDPFIVSFPDDITVSVPFGTPSTPVNWEEPTAFDNSGTVFPTKSAEPGSSFPTGQTTPVTYTFSDPTGNSVTRQFTVTVVELPDGIDPFIVSFPDDITVSVPFGTPSTPVNWEEPTAFDNSGTVFPTKSAEPGSSFPTGQTTPVTYTFSDPTGNSVTRQFTVTVVELPDGTPPEVSDFPQDITRTVPFGTTSVTVTWVEPTVTDNSGTVTPSSDRPSGSSFLPGTTPVTYNFVDPTGNSVTRSFNVNVIVLPDSTDPFVVSFPDDITVSVPFGTPSTPVNWEEPTAFDNSGTVFPSKSAEPGSSFPTGQTTPVTYTFSDPTGNSVTRQFTVTVVELPDGTPPEVSDFPEDITRTVPFGTTSVTVTWVEPTVTDNSGTVTPSSDRPSGSSFLPGTTPVTYNFVDPTGNSVTRSFNVNVIVLPDSTDPFIVSFPDDITVSVPFGTPSTPVNWEEPTAFDNSGTVFPSKSAEPGSSFPTGQTTPVTYTFSDPTGNSVTRQFTVTVVELPDGIDPFIVSFPDDITVSVPFGTPSTPVNWEEPTAFDNSGTVFPTKSAEPGSSFPTGQTTPVTYTFSDPTGNSVTRQFTVTVVELPDGTPPEVSDFPEDITRTVPFGTTSVTVTWVEPTVTDNSGTVTPSSDRPSGSSFLPGTTPVTYNFVDPTGNSVTRSFNVNVIVLPDSTDPFIVSFPDDITVSVPFGTPSTPVNWEEPTAFDNSGTVFPTKSAEPGSSFPTGQTTPVTYTFSDPTGNSVTRQFTVTVVELPDGTPPEVSDFPEDITRTVPFGTTSVTVTWVEPTVTDNSGTVTPSSDRPSGSSFLPGTTPVTYNFVDPTGNSVTRSFNVNVIVLPDSTDPFIVSFPDDITVSVPFGTPSTPVNWEEPTAFDNSGTVFPTKSAEPGSSFPTGQTTPVTYTFSDPTGNSVTRQFTVTVVELPDGIDPFIVSFPDDITVSVPFGTPSTPVNWEEPTAFDNSGTVFPTKSAEPGSSFPTGQTTPVTYTFSDPTGNSVTRQFTVTVVELPDGTPPEVSDFPEDITRTVPFGTTSVTVTWVEPTVTDNSGTVTPSSDRPSGSSFSPGTTPVTYNFVDPTGNSVTRSFNVNVIVLPDSTDPFIVSFPDDITVSVPFGTPSTPVNWEEPTAFDNSGTVFPSKSAEPGSSFPTGQTTPVTYTFSDPTGNSVTRQFTVTVVELPDGTPPEVSDFPEDITRTVPFGTTSVTVTWAEPTVTDNSGTVTPSSDRPSGSSFSPGTTPVTYNFVDPTGNSVTRSFNVNVIVLPDSTDPFIVSFPDDITVSVPFGTPSTPVNWEEPTAFDNSGTVFPTKSAEPGSSFPTGQTTPVTYTFSDPTGNSVTRQFTVTVVELADGTPPEVLVFPEDITRTVPFGTTSVTVTWVEPTVTDNSGTVTPSSDRPSGSSFLPGTTPVTYNFVDPTGNSVTRSFNVNVNVLPDAIRPVITATSDDVTVTVPFQSPGTTVDWTEPTATDNSGSFSTTKTNEPGTFFPTGSSTPVTYTFTDAAGNFASTTFTVRVIEEADMVSPMLLFCQMPITYTVVSGMAPVPVSFTAPTAADNSGNVNLLFNTKSPGDLFDAGATTVEYRFGDQAGNVASCTFVVTIVEANPCGEQPCLNGAACVPETLTTYRCICPDCYSGDNCEIARDACQGNTCQNGAVCAAQPGSCTQYECQCPACYTGQSCQTLVNSCDNNQCANGAACAPAAEGCVEYTCQCPPCFTGRYCTIPISACDSSSCQNGAVCMPSTQNPNTAYACSEYKCSCTNCFTGVFCESQRDACNPNPCVNGGVCSATSGSCTSYSCECPPCFSGFNCEISVPNPCDNNPCLNNGVCSTVQGSCGAHTCACPDTHIGLNCESPVVANPNPCNSFPCKNGATCLTVDSSNYICMCAPNYVGPNCLTPKAQQPQMDLCQNTPCNNGANCYNSYNSNTGTNSIPQYSCVCASGFTGSNCNIQTGDSPALDICNKAERPPCRQGAVCSNTFHSIDQDVDYFCTCPVGYSGHNCQTESVDPCASNPCRNGANCASFNTYFMCECLTGFGGTTCDSRIGDTTAPVISGCPASIFTNAGTQSFSTVTWTAPTATDESGVVFQTFASHQPGQQFPVGATPVTYVFSDLSQNYARCVFFVTVSNNVPVTPGPSDNTPPVISNCPMGASATAPSGSSGTEAIWVEPTATDDSLPLTVVRSHTPGAFFPLGVTDVTYTISDAAGNSAECKFVVMINSPNMPDGTAPVISNCPENQVVNTNTGSASVSWAEPTAVDNSGQTPGLAQSHVPPASFPVNSVTRVTYIFYDTAGNFDSCTFTVAVQPGTTPTDMTPPVISNCPSDTTITVAPGTTSATVNWVEPTATDGDGLTPTVARSHAPNTAFPLGPTVVSYIFRDSTGNEANCNFVVTVSEAGDTTDPVFTNCPDNIVSYVNGPTATASIDFPTPTAVDNSGVTPVVSGSVGSPHTMGVGSVVASYVARDGSGNEATCTFSISVVVDSQAPVISGCPANQVGTLATGSTSVALSWVEPTATDNSGAVSTSRTHQPGQSFSEGETPVTYTFSDSAGNQNTCSFLITVNAASTVNPCSSSPCPVSQDCYYRSNPIEYLCLPTQRRRRDANQEECLCKNGGVCADNDEGFSCACPSNFTGIICEEEVKIPKQHTSDLNTLEVFNSTSSYFEWMMGSVMAILGVIIIILALTICRMAPRTSSKLDSVDKASLVY